MKKLSFMLIPFLAVPFFVGCNKGLGDPKPLNECSWDKINEVSKAGKAGEWFKVGDEKTVVVNNQPHRVRIIGFNHDDLADGTGKAGITFEFADLISDSNGYSLASLWNEWPNDPIHFPKYSAGHYANSTIRKNLTGEGDGLGGWYEKGMPTKSSTYAGKSVLDMLSNDLRKNLEMVKKKVTVVNKTNDGWEETYINDKLFLLGVNEMNAQGEHDVGIKESLNSYDYYKESSPYPCPLGDTVRTKSQIKGADGAMTDLLGTEITDVLIQYGARSHAGFNVTLSDRCCSYYWSRSIYDDIYGNAVWHIYFDGSFSNNVSTVYNFAFPIAPAFCI